MDTKSSKRDVSAILACVISSVMKKWYIILFFTCLCACSFDVIKTLSYTPLYSSKVVTAIVSSSSGTASSETAEKCVKSLDYILKSNVAQQYIVEKTGQEAFRGTIRTGLMSATNFYTIEVLAPTQKEAYQSLRCLLEWYEKTSTSAHFGYDLSIVEEHYMNNGSLSQNNHFDHLKKAGLLGLTLSTFVLCLAAYFSDAIKSAREIDQKVEARLFARLPREIKKGRSWNPFKKNRQAILISHFKTSFEYVEAVKKLATKVLASARKHAYQTILITSSIENEGKSSVAVNLALALAGNGKKVVLIDGDLRQPSLQKILETRPKQNLIHVLDGECSWQEATLSMARYEIDVLFSKNVRDRAGTYLESAAFKHMLEEMKAVYDYVIIDSAPCRHLTDTLYIASQADATLLVVRQNSASAMTINDTIYRLVRASANVIGCVYNGRMIEWYSTKNSYRYRYGQYRYRHQRGSGYE